MTMELIGQVLDEKYHIEQPLGQGGMGTVFLATHVGTKRPVALKIIRPQFMAYSEFVERFKREAEAAGRLRNPNVVNVTDFGFTNVNGSRIGYLVMEYLDGCSLADVLNEEARLPLNFVVEVLEQVSSAIEEAHQQGIIHRDLKPDNIWLEPTGRGDYLVKVLDFGLAKLADDAQSSQINPTNHAHPLNAKEVSVITVAQPDSNISGSNISGNNISSNNISAEFSEAETNFQLSTQSTESITQAQPFMNSGKVVDNHEIVTQAQPAYPIAIAQNDAQNDVNSDVKDEEAATQIQPAEGLTARTSSKNTSPALTRVGAILGTPIYMSPEQCAGRPLDSRTDIYSLGVIAYEMLAGQPPFKGNIESLIAQHKSAIPTPIRKIRPSIPRKVAELVMSMLAKDPDQRPESAAAFASALRARSEGPITLLRQAISVYIQNFRSFLQLSILTHLPSFLFILIAALFGLFSDGTFNMTSEEPHTNAQIIFLVVLVFGMVTIHSIAYTLALVAFVPVTVQTILLPLRRTQLKPVFLMLKRRLKDIVTTFVHCWVRIFLWSGLAFIPGIIASINYFLIYPVLVVEDLKNKAALERSRLLVQRARLMVIGTWAIQMAISIYSSLLASGLQTKGPVVKMGAKTISTTTQTLIGFFLGSLSNLFFFPLLAILLVLLYLNTRKSGGETLKEVLGQYMEAELPTTKWQQRMEEKLRLRTRIQSTHISAHNTPANRSNPSEKNL